MNTFCVIDGTEEETLITIDGVYLNDIMTMKYQSILSINVDEKKYKVNMNDQKEILITK
jgi:hypothetical protein